MSQIIDVINGTLSLSGREHHKGDLVTKFTTQGGITKTNRKKERIVHLNAQQLRSLAIECLNVAEELDMRNKLPQD